MRPSYGLDLLNLIGSVKTKQDASALGGQISMELTKDERIFTALVTVVATTEGPRTTFEITVEAETTEGPFTLQVGVDDVTVELLRIEAEG